MTPAYMSEFELRAWLKLLGFSQPPIPIYGRPVDVEQRPGEAWRISRTSYGFLVVPIPKWVAK